MEPTEHRITVGDVELAYLACGDTGPLALCLHGFPDSAQTWRHLLPALADAGFRAIAPWLRGYAPSSVDPKGRHQVGASVGDANALHEALDGDGDAVLIGHDWGARIATGAAVHSPERWRAIVTGAVPPSGAVAQGFLTYRQLRRSWYMFLFQTPLAEIAVSMNDLEFIDHLWHDWSPGYDASEDLPHVKAALRDPANLAAALGYYRATLNPAEHTVPELQELEDAIGGTPEQPHLFMHGSDDGCMGVELAHLAAPFMPSPKSLVEIVEHTGHFFHLENPGAVNKMIVDFLT